MDRHMLTAARRAEQLLMETFGGAIRLGEGHNLGGSARTRVLRFPVLEGPPSAPANIVVKQSTSEVFDPTSADDAAWLLFNDWASLEFLSQIAAPVPLVPALYGGDRQGGFLIMEDLQPKTRLDHLLLGNDPDAAEAGLIAYAEVHGRLHALTINRRAEYLRIRERLGPAASANSYYSYRWLPAALQEIAALLDVPIQPGALEELEGLRAALVTPGPFLTLVQSDAAPDNFLWDGETWCLIDFEGARYTHALLEGAYCRMPFPTCWCVYRLPEALIQRMEARYRAELSKSCPAAANETLFYRGLVEACLTWALSFHRMMRPLEKMLEQDRCLVALTDRQRFLLYLNTAAHASETFEHLPSVGRTVHQFARRLAQRWPEAVDPPYYPAFRDMSQRSL
ncbi:MAG TPA: phosphotransferase [Ktedonobacterales bacterium]|nr:phosphotransferase [Ktedonobacterales bacterium]